MDALYVLNYASKLAPNYRNEEIRNAVRLSGQSVLEFWQQDRGRLFQEHPHIVLSIVSAFGLLQ